MGYFIRRVDNMQLLVIHKNTLSTPQRYYVTDHLLCIGFQKKGFIKPYFRIESQALVRGKRKRVIDSMIARSREVTKLPTSSPTFTPTDLSRAHAPHTFIFIFWQPA